MIHHFFTRLKLAHTPKFIRAMMPDAIWQIPTSKKEVFLTFDDGPQPEITESVLELLEEYNAKATFFCIGENVTKHPDIYQKIINAGHAVGNHTYNHLRGSETDNQQYFKNIQECKKVVDSQLFRPPFGRLKNSQYRKIKTDYKIIMWSALSWDFDASLTPEQCAKKVINNSENGSIVVFHDSKKAKKNCLPALEIVLKELSKRGFIFSILKMD